MGYSYGARGRGSYGKGSAMDRAGGENGYYLQQRSKFEGQKASGMVEVFDFREDAPSSYGPGNGFEHYNTPRASAIEHLRNRCSLEGDSIRAKFDKSLKAFKPDDDGELVDLSKLAEVTLGEGNLHFFTCWAN